MLCQRVLYTTVYMCYMVYFVSSVFLYAYRKCFIYILIWASLVAQMLKHLPAKREVQVQSLDWEDPPGEGNGNSLKYSCLGNLMDRGTRQAAFHRVAKGRTRLRD